MANVVALVQNDVEPEPEGWDAFWILYPRHVAKKDAHKAWDRIDPALHVEIIVATARWRKIWLKRGEPDFIPHPASWLNAERWEDELPAGVTVSSAAHVPFTPNGPTPPRTELPEGVRAMLRKLTGRT